MNNTIIRIGTVTYAIKAKKILSRNGISSKLVKLGDIHSGGGCTYGLEFDNNNFYSAVIELRKAEIQYSLYKNDLP